MRPALSTCSTGSRRIWRADAGSLRAGPTSKLHLGADAGATKFAGRLPKEPVGPVDTGRKAPYLHAVPDAGLKPSPRIENLSKRRLISIASVGDSLMVEQRTLTPLVLVRIQVPQPNLTFRRFNPLACPQASGSGRGFHKHVKGLAKGGDHFAIFSNLL